MAWGKLDDRYDDNVKIKRAWRRHPRAVGLHAQAITYSARHEQDGRVDLEWIEEKLPDPSERDECVRVLVELRLFDPLDNGDGFAVHDFLDYNPSAEELEELREARQKAGRKGGSAPRTRKRKAGAKASA